MVRTSLILRACCLASISFALGCSSNSNRDSVYSNSMESDDPVAVTARKPVVEDSTLYQTTYQATKLSGHIHNNSHSPENFSLDSDGKDHNISALLLDGPISSYSSTSTSLTEPTGVYTDGANQFQTIGNPLDQPVGYADSMFDN